jgi:5-methyltetrahydrofolate--homocysteine methyltransferase
MAEADEQKRERTVAVASSDGFAPPSISHAIDIPQPPDLKQHVVADWDLAEVFPYINPVMLYTRHLGFKGKFEDALVAGDPRAVELRRGVETVEAEMLARKDIRGRAVFRFFPAKAKRERLVLYASDFTTEIGGFSFGRQQKDGGLCLTDFVLPADDPRRDYVALFATSVGPGVRALAESWKEKGDYLKSHVLQALAIESAEALAELLHARLRTMWGIGDPEGTTKKDLFQAHYRGVRVSFGYPACPRLEDQTELFRLLGVTEAIGVELTEGFMMDPESSVSALVFHHPEARYFNLSEGDLEQLERSLESSAVP